MHMAELYCSVVAQQHKRNVFVGIYIFYVGVTFDADGADVETVYSYVVTVLQANPAVLPYPQPGKRWTAGHEVHGLTNGDLEAGKSQTVTLVVPGAEEVVVKTENNQIPLQQVRVATRRFYVVFVSA